MYEIRKVRQLKDEPERRWFFDREMDLTVWFDESDLIIGFQLCYDKISDHHALTWHKEVGYRHHRVNDGEGLDCIGRFKSIPVLEMDGTLNSKLVMEKFKMKCDEIPEYIREFVQARIHEFAL